MKKFLFSIMLLVVGMITANAFTSHDVGQPALRTESVVHMDYAPIVPLFVYEFITVPPIKSSPVYNGYGLTPIANNYAVAVSPLLLNWPASIKLTTTIRKRPFTIEQLYLRTTGSLRYC